MKRVAAFEKTNGFFKIQVCDNGKLSLKKKIFEKTVNFLGVVLKPEKLTK